MSRALANLKRSGTLDLSRSDLSSLPTTVQKHIGDVHAAEAKGQPPDGAPLSHLILSYNCFQSLPLCVVYLASSLRHLNLDHNDLSFFPQQIFSLVSLEILDLAHNQLTEIPPSISRLTTLRMLSLNDNALRTIPEELYKLSDTLGVVNVCNNFLPVLSVPLQHLPIIQGLNRQREPSLILPHLYLGAYESAQCHESLAKNSITHILTVGGGMPSLFLTPSKNTATASLKIEYEVFSTIQDITSQNLLSFLPAAFAFIDKGRTQGNVLIHCREGVSRSGSLVIAYVMRERGIPLSAALEFVIAQRSMVKPNSGFQSVFVLSV